MPTVSPCVTPASRRRLTSPFFSGSLCPKARVRSVVRCRAWHAVADGWCTRPSAARRRKHRRRPPTVAWAIECETAPFFFFFFFFFFTSFCFPPGSRGGTSLPLKRSSYLPPSASCWCDAKQPGRDAALEPIQEHPTRTDALYAQAHACLALPVSFAAEPASCPRFSLVPLFLCLCPCLYYPYCSHVDRRRAPTKVSRRRPPRHGTAPAQQYVAPTGPQALCGALWWLFFPPHPGVARASWTLVFPHFPTKARLARRVSCPQSPRTTRWPTQAAAGRCPSPADLVRWRGPLCFVFAHGSLAACISPSHVVLLLFLRLLLFCHATACVGRRRTVTEGNGLRSEDMPGASGEPGSEGGVLAKWRRGSVLCSRQQSPLAIVRGHCA